MEPLDYIIIILFIIVVFIKYYTAEQNETETENYTTLWTPFSLSSSNVGLVNNQCIPHDGLSPAVNIQPNNKPQLKNYGNFGIIGKFPAIPICDSCGLDFGCVGYDWSDTDDKNMNVCRKCSRNGIYKNYNDLSKPLYVNARSAGRPRQCRQLN